MNKNNLQTEATDTNSNGTAGTDPAKPAKPDPIGKCRAKFTADGGKFANGKPVMTTAQSKAAKAAAKELADAQSKVEAAQSALDSAREVVYAASQKVMEATGGCAVTVGGRELIPMAKGERVYFRGAGQRSSVEL